MSNSFNHIKLIAYWLDNKFAGPFGMRFGLDPLIGLVPGVGPFVTTVFSVYILLTSYFLGCSLSVFFRMLLNIVIEFIVGSIPLLGQFFDFFWKANTKNIELLEAYKLQPEQVHQRSKWILMGVIFTLVLFVIAAFIGSAVVAYKLFQALWALF